MIASSIVDMEYAYVTGAASGLGLAISTFLTRKGIKVFMADFNGEALEIAANEISASFAVVDVSNWDSQLKGFKQALAEYGRIDYVYPIAGIGENTWIPPLSPSQSADDFAKPNLSIIDVNVSGLLFTLALALQQFRRQVVGGNGFRGKIVCPGSIMGIYPCAENPLYSASKHTVTGLVRSYGMQLPREQITMNAFCPSVIRTGFSQDTFYDSLEDENLLTPIDCILEVIEKTLGTSPISGQCFEAGPNYGNGQGLIQPKFPRYIDKDLARVVDLVNARGKAKRET